MPFVINRDLAVHTIWPDTFLSHWSVSKRIFNDLAA